ncbi:MAG: ATP-binding protein [Gammaproteobacteria bacterium]
MKSTDDKPDRDVDATHERALADGRDLDARFGTLLESVPDAVVLVNEDGVVVLANQQAENLFGYRPGELLWRTVETLLPPRYRNDHAGHRSTFFERPRTRPMGVGLELFGLRSNGTEFPVEISLSPLALGARTLAMAAIRDTSERKTFELALRQKNLELADANRAKDQFLATMSHELRTPLNAILGFTGTLLMGLPGPLNTEQERQLGTVKRNAQHLLALINDILDVVRIEAGKVELHLERVEVQDVVREVESTLRMLAESRGLSFTVALPEPPLVLSTDRRALTQILLNLANNAIKFTDQGGVRISVTREARAGGADAVIAVADTGIGIREADRARLFEAFAQLDEARERLQEGTGLGLHLSARLAELLGGHINLYSEHGAGSVFSLTLPAPA